MANAKENSADQDIITFLEYQHVMKEPDIRNNKKFKQEIFETYKPYMKPGGLGEKLMDDYQGSILKHVNEEKWLSQNLKPLVEKSYLYVREKRTAPHKEHDQILKRNCEDLAHTMTQNKLHPLFQKHPDLIKRAVGVVSNIASNHKEKAAEAEKKATIANNRLKVLVTNLKVFAGWSQEKIEEIQKPMDIAKKQAQDQANSLENDKTKKTSKTKKSKLSR